MSFEKDWTVHPGETLADLLEERGMARAELAKRLGVWRSTVSDICNGHRLYNAEIALGLEEVFDVPAVFWMNLKTNYELDLAKGRKV